MAVGVSKILSVYERVYEGSAAVEGPTVNFSITTVPVLAGDRHFEIEQARRTDQCVCST